MVRPENFQVHFAQEALRKRQTFKSSSFGPESKNAGRFRRYTLSGRRTRLELIILKGMNLKPESSDLRENQTLYWGPSSKRVGALGRQGGVPKIRETFVTSACSKDTRAHTHAISVHADTHFPVSAADSNVTAVQEMNRFLLSPAQVGFAVLFLVATDKYLLDFRSCLLQTGSKVGKYCAFLSLRVSLKIPTLSGAAFEFIKPQGIVFMYAPPWWTSRDGDGTTNTLTSTYTSRTRIRHRQCGRECRLTSQSVLQY